MARAMEWRQIARFPAFEVSECGDVRRISTGKRMRGFVDADGYLRLSLRDASGDKKSPSVHAVVAEAFIGPSPSEKHEVAHENGSRVLNHFANLRWALPVENQADRVDHATDPKGERNPRATITEADVQTIRIEYRRIKARGSGRRVAELDERYGLCRAQIIRIAMGQAWSHVPMPTVAILEVAA